MKALPLALLALVACGSEPAPSAPPPLVVRLSPGREPNQAAIRFENRGERPLTIVKPMDGSESCWISPFYRFTVRDDAGRILANHERCAQFGDLWDGTKWPDDYVVTLAPGESVGIETWLDTNVPADGLYGATVEYEYDPTLTRWKVPGGAWTGRARSEPAKLPMAKRRE